MFGIAIVIHFLKGAVMLPLICFYLIFPIVIIILCMHVKWVNKIGAVLVCYITGALIGNSGLMPQDASQVQDILSSACVAIALPLLLFSMDVRAWMKTAGKAILSMAGAMAIVVALAGAGTVIIAENTTDSWKLGGLAIGVYTGGTPNMAAIKTALDVDPTDYVMMHTYDVFISFAYILFAITIAQKLLHRFLPKFRFQDTVTDSQADYTSEDIHSYENMISGPVLKGLLSAFLLSAAILGVSVGIAELFPKSASTAVTILMITTLGICASFIPKIRTIAKTYQLGMVFILVFCLVVGSMADISKLIHINWPIFLYICLCVFGTFILHAIFCRLFGIDTDTFLVTSVSAVCSPPFVPVVAQAINNKQVILSGLTTGIIGYAVGNYLGIGFAYVFKYFM